MLYHKTFFDFRFKHPDQVTLPIHFNYYTPANEQKLLVSLIGGTRGNVLEIGCNEGHTTRNFALSFPNKKVYAVDYSGSNEVMCGEQAKENLPPEKIGHLAKEIPNVIVVDIDSRTFDYKDKNIGFVFVDGDHSYNGVKSDTENALKGINSNGVIAWHDFLEENAKETWVGVRKYLTELSENMDIYHIEGTHVCYAIIR